MCGIIGYIGNNDATPVLIHGLNKLEYRGYDSAGVALYNDNKIDVVKIKGRVQLLSDELDEKNIKSNLGIGHTRWATHGEPSYINSHPHFNADKTLSVVHNGIIENYITLKDELIKEGYKFLSETDTEVIVHLADKLKKQGLNSLEIMFKLVDTLKGAYAIGLINTAENDKLLCARKDSPLIIGQGDGENFIASDMPAILNKTRDIYFLEDLDVAIITKDNVTIYDKTKKEVTRELNNIKWDMESAEKGGFDYFMEKEIFEQPKVVRDTISGRLKEDGITLDNIKITKEDLDKINRIYIVACGTAYYAGIIGKFAIEKLTKIPVVSDVASEFRYNDPIIDENTLLIVVSQSGETADTLATLKLGKQKGARVLAVVNVVGSSIARYADDIFYTLAGPEIAVASTKAYTSQVVAMYLIALHFALTKNTIEKEEYLKIKNSLEQLPELIQEVLNKQDEIKQVVKKYINSKNIFYIGRGLDYFVCLEGSLKLKELAYLHAEAYQAGELKHGPIALLEKGSLIVGVTTQLNVWDKTVSNLQECKARNASLLGISFANNKELETIADDIITIPETHYLLAPILANIVQQFIAFNFSVELGLDVDKPRNLAKSVTVE